MVKCGCGSGVSKTSFSGAVCTLEMSRVVSVARTTPISPSFIDT